MRLDRDGLTQLLKEALDAQATDIHLKTASRPALRMGRDLVAMAHPVLQGPDTERAAGVLLRMAKKELGLHDLKETEFVLSARGLGRIQIRIFRQRGDLGILLRPLPNTPPTLKALGVPGEEGRLLLQSGLVLVCGQRRVRLVSGLVDAYNRAAKGHVLMLENPILTYHQDLCAQISQREIGQDTESWMSGIQGATEHDVDVLALSAQPGVAARKALVLSAEEGRCVVLAVPAVSPERAKEAFLEGFEGEQRERYQARLDDVWISTLSLGRAGFKGLHQAERLGQSCAA
jgi:twitching motility protein PilT